MSESLGEYAPSDPKLATRRGSSDISGRTGESGELRYRANSRNFGRARAIKQLTSGQRYFEGNFWLPERPPALTLARVLSELPGFLSGYLGFQQALGVKMTQNRGRGPSRTLSSRVCRTSKGRSFQHLCVVYRLEVSGFLQQQCQFPALFSALFLRYFPITSRFGCESRVLRGEPFLSPMVSPGETGGPLSATPSEFPS